LISSKNFLCVRPIIHNIKKDKNFLIFTYLVIAVCDNDVFWFLATSEEMLLIFTKNTSFSIDVRTSQHLLGAFVDTSSYKIVASAETPFTLIYFVFDHFLLLNNNNVAQLNNVFYPFLVPGLKTVLRYQTVFNRKIEYDHESKRRLLIALLGNKKFLSETGLLRAFAHESSVRYKLEMRLYFFLRKK
jgi:hypothetical protein